MRVTRIWSGAVGPPPVHLGLQGGGAHGAVTWGVLDRLLEADRFPIRAVSGTSAGAMNAVVLADGLARGGPEAARAALAGFWQAVGELARLSPVRRGVIDRAARARRARRLARLPGGRRAVAARAAAGR